MQKPKQILMQAYANKEAVELTLKTKKATYWSRSRNEIWVKGETIGHTQKIIRYPPTATMTHCSTSLNRRVPHATQANTVASTTNYSNPFYLLFSYRTFKRHFPKKKLRFSVAVCFYLDRG